MNVFNVTEQVTCHTLELEDRSNEYEKSTSLELKEHRIKGFLMYCTNIESLITNKRIALEPVLVSLIPTKGGNALAKPIQHFSINPLKIQPCSG